MDWHIISDTFPFLFLVPIFFYITLQIANRHFTLTCMVCFARQLTPLKVVYMFELTPHYRYIFLFYAYPFHPIHDPLIRVLQ